MTLLWVLRLPSQLQREDWNGGREADPPKAPRIRRPVQRTRVTQPGGVGSDRFGHPRASQTASQVLSPEAGSGAFASSGICPGDLP